MLGLASPSPTNSNPNPNPNPRYVGLVGDELRAPPLPPMFDAAEFDALVVELGSHYAL